MCSDPSPFLCSRLDECDECFYLLLQATAGISAPSIPGSVAHCNNTPGSQAACSPYQIAGKFRRYTLVLECLTGKISPGISCPTQTSQIGCRLTTHQEREYCRATRGIGKDRWRFGKQHTTGDRLCTRGQWLGSSMTELYNQSRCRHCYHELPNSRNSHIVHWK